MKNRLIIFDFFGVICSEIAPFWFANHFDPEQAVSLKDKFFKPADLGRVTLDEVFDAISKQYGFSIKSIVEEWNSYIKIDFELVHYIEKLRNHADIVLLSNAPLGVVEDLINTYNLDGLFDYVFVSSKIKLSKPDISIYKYCLSSLNKTYEEMYMIDDNPNNLAPLSQLDIKAILYKSIDDVKKVFDVLL